MSTANIYQYLTNLEREISEVKTGLDHALITYKTSDIRCNTMRAKELKEVLTLRKII